MNVTLNYGLKLIEHVCTQIDHNIFVKASSITCVVLYIIMALHGCSTLETRMVDAQVVGSSFPFIRDGVITRNEILERLGQPASYFEDGRVVIYWLQEDSNGVLQVTTKNSTALSINNRSYLHNLEYGTKESKSGYYNLILIFTDNDILEEHSLVFIR